MARRVGANKRQNNRQRRTMAKHAVRTTLPRLVTAFAVAGCAAALAGGAWLAYTPLRQWAKSTKHLSVRAIAVHGVEHLDNNAIVKAAGLLPGMPLLDVKAGAIREVLRRNPWVRDVSVRRRPNGTVNVRVVERKPIVLANVGRVYQMDDQGILLDMPIGSYLSMPIVSGLRDTTDQYGRRCIRGGDLRRFTTFWERARMIDERQFSHVSQLDFSEEELVRLAFDNRPETVEMSTAEVEKRMTQLWQLVAALGDEKVLEPATIDMCYNNIAFLRR